MTAFKWYLGQNDLKAFVCDLRGGGCYDGLQPDGVNLNQGAESTLAWLLSLVQMHLSADRTHAESPAAARGRRERGRRERARGRA